MPPWCRRVLRLYPGDRFGRKALSVGGFAWCALLAMGHAVDAAESAPLVLEARIPLGDVKGRIDHMTVDLNRQRLYVAELGNDSVGVVDLKAQQVIRTLTGLKEPQGVGFVPATDTLYVANAGDGSLRLFQGEGLTVAGKIDLGEDPDNVRVDATGNQVLVGYGTGALARIDAGSRKLIGTVPLQAHPEGFQLEAKGERIFINVPDAHEIAVVDRRTNRQLASWPTHALRGNFPLAIDQSGHRVLATFRYPPMLGVFEMRDGAQVAAVDTCGDADDVFIDAKRDRVYVSCGEGFIDVLAEKQRLYVSIARLRTRAGARTALFVPELDRLFVAARATLREPAAIWVFRPTP